MLRKSLCVLAAAVLIGGVLVGQGRADGGNALKEANRASSVLAETPSQPDSTTHKVYYIHTQTYCSGSALVTKEVTFWSDGRTSSRRSSIPDALYCREHRKELAKR